MTKEKRLTIALLTEKLQKLTNKKVVLREDTKVNSAETIWNNMDVWNTKVLRKQGLENEEIKYLRGFEGDAFRKLDDTAKQILQGIVDNQSLEDGEYSYKGKLEFTVENGKAYVNAPSQKVLKDFAMFVGVIPKFEKDGSDMYIMYDIPTAKVKEFISKGLVKKF